MSAGSSFAGVERVALVYIEFIRRRASADLDGFRKVLTGGQQGWADSYAADRLVLAVGRTWRIGPDMEYLFVWHCPGHDLERLDDWEASFVGGEADQFHEPFKLAARIERAGCYEPLLEPQRGTRRRYYAEWFERRPGASSEDVASYLSSRGADTGSDLNVAVERIGLMAPDPPGLAIWGVDSWAASGPLARAARSADAPIHAVTSSLYADIGLEQH